MRTLSVFRPEDGNAAVFTATPNALKAAWKRLIQRARANYLEECKMQSEPDRGLFVDLHFHDLRHEATSRIAQRLPNPMDTAIVTGHRDMNMLKRYYHTTAEELAAKLN